MQETRKIDSFREHPLINSGLLCVPDQAKAYHSQEILECIAKLAAAEDLTEADCLMLKGMLLAKNQSGHTVLTLTLKNKKLDQVSSIFQAVEKLGKDKDSVLEQMLLANDSPTGTILQQCDDDKFSLILELVKKIPKEKQDSVLKDMLVAKSRGSRESSAFISVLRIASHSPVRMHLMLQAVMSLPETTQISIFKETLGLENRSTIIGALMWASRSNPIAVPSIFQAAATFSEPERGLLLKEMLTVKDSEGINMLIWGQQNEVALELILKELKSMYSVLHISKTDSSFRSLLSMLPESAQKKHLFSLYEFIQPTRFASPKQTQYVRDWFFADSTSQAEKDSLSTLKPSQVARWKKPSRPGLFNATRKASEDIEMESLQPNGGGGSK
jgi:hypothetical protein